MVTTRSLSPEALVKDHISQLKTYNELRDAGLKLAQLIADQKMCKLKNVFEEMGFEMNDN